MRKRFILSSLLLSGFFSAGDSLECSAQQSEEAKKPVIFTVQEDHQNMMQQLGITKLRPGPSGNQQAPNPANYDEALANPHPDLPDVMKLANGEPVTTPQQWWQQRHPEIVEAFEREVLGRIPSNVPAVKWEVRKTRDIPSEASDARGQGRHA